MTLASFYPLLFWCHVSLAATSVGLFAARGAAVLLGQSWPMQKAWRMASVFIDVGLLAAGASLWWLMAHHPLREPWLGVKLFLLLPTYVVLGSLALRRARTRAGRLGCYLLALLCAAAIASIAHTRQPLAWWAPQASASTCCASMSTT